HRDAGNAARPADINTAMQPPSSNQVVHAGAHGANIDALVLQGLVAALDLAHAHVLGTTALRSHNDVKNLAALASHGTQAHGIKRLGAGVGGPESWRRHGFDIYCISHADTSFSKAMAPASSSAKRSTLTSARARRASSLS